MDPIITASLISGGAGLLGGLLGGKNKDYSQIPLETPEQTRARQMLNNFAQSGVFGDFTAGQDLGLGLGDYNMTDAEKSGQSSLMSLLQSGLPSQYALGDNALKDILGGSMDQVRAQFDPFQTQVQRQIKDSTNSAKRSLGYAGNLYSTKAIRDIGDIEARGNETLTAQLANLTNEALNRRLQAIPLAYQSAQNQEATTLGRIGAASTYGSLARTLNDSKIKARDAEILRRRQELQLPIQAAQSVIGSSPNFGVPNVSVPQTSPFQGVLDMAGSLGGQYLGNELFMRQYKNLYAGKN